MNWLDASTYLLEYGGLGFVVVLVAAISVIPVFIVTSEMGYDLRLKHVLVALIAVFIIGTGIGLIPTHEKLFRLKISKIKNEAVTKENLSQGIEAIERIGKKLECKYLGCDE